MPALSQRQPVPPRALAISVVALAIPVAAAFWLPNWTSSGLGMLIWLTALIPAFLLSYYRGWQGVAIALSGGMAVIAATQVSVVVFGRAQPNWSLLGTIVLIYLAVSVGIAGLAEVLRGERQAAEELALIDRLTGLPNRHHLEEALGREFAAAERGRELTVVMFDLDSFKTVNDRHGHAAGDATLKVFANILRTNTRRENLSARFGGEEFVSILRDTDAESAAKFAQRVLNQMRDWRLPWGSQTASAGVAEYRKGMGTFELLLVQADHALYQAKDGGRDVVRVAPPYEQPVEAVSGPAARTSLELPLEAAPPKPATTRIYIVDDDPAPRTALKRILVRGGHDVWDTGDPLEAIRRFRDSPPAERPEVIITDVIMPEMSGMRMADQLAKVNPDVKMIYMSGYVQSEIQWEGSPGSVAIFLEKPVELEALLAAVQRLIGPGETPLDQPASAAPQPNR